MKNLFLIISAFLIFVSNPLWAQQEKKIVTSFSILADITKQIGGDHVIVGTLIGPNGDAHSFQPKPSDAKAIAVADMVILNGLGFEGWMERLVKNSKTKAKLVTATEGVKALEVGGDDDHHDHHHDHHKHHDDDHASSYDPHAWQSVPNVMLYVATIRDALIALDKPHEQNYRENAQKYLIELRLLDAWIRAQLGLIPAAERKIITNHDALGYYAKEYGLEIIPAQGLHSGGQPSAAAMKKIIDNIRQSGARALFIENISDGRLMRKLEKDTGAIFGGVLYADAVSDKPPADNYVGLMRWNTTAIVETLKKAAQPPAQPEAETEKTGNKTGSKTDEKPKAK